MLWIGFLFFVVSFLLGLISVKVVSKYNYKAGVVGVDINKKDKRRIPESTGIALLVPVWVFTIFFSVFFNQYTFVLWALMLSSFSLMGFLDDIKPKFLAKTRNWLSRAVCVAVVSIIFSALLWNNPEWWKIVIGALFIAGFASFENTFAGLNGWEVGSGFILSVFIGLLLLNSSLLHLFPAAMALSGAILALLAFNVFPARVFPGDSGTLLIGSGLAGLMVLTQSIHLLIVSFLFLVPHIIDFFAKVYTNPSDPSQRKQKPYKLKENGKLAVPSEKKGYDFAKILLKLFGPMKESPLMLLIWAIVIINCFVVFVLLG